MTSQSAVVFPETHILLRQMTTISPLLLAHGRLAPLRPESKRPWLRSLIDGASNDPAVIAEWQTTKVGCSWGLRLESDELIVLDLERPGKGSAAGGVRMIDWIELDQGERLPFGPVATTQSGGQHRYFTLPAAYRGLIKNWTAALPGVDIRVKGGLVVIPPSPGREWIESFDECELPELPVWFCELILSHRGPSGDKAPVTQEDVAASSPVQTPFQASVASAASLQIIRQHIPDKLWFRMRKSGDFMGLWSRTRRLKDNSASSFEYALAIYAFLRGLTRNQVLNLIIAWWAKHSIKGNLNRLRKNIIPAAEDTTRPTVDAFIAKEEAKQAGKTSNRILAFLSDEGTSTPAEIGKALGISRRAAHNQLTRLTASNQVVHTEGGAYSPRTQDCKHTHSVDVDIHITSTRKTAASAASPSPATERQSTIPQEQAA